MLNVCRLTAGWSVLIDNIKFNQRDKDLFILTSALSTSTRVYHKYVADFVIDVRATYLQFVSVVTLDMFCPLHLIIDGNIVIYNSLTVAYQSAVSLRRPVRMYV